MRPPAVEAPLAWRVWVQRTNNRPFNKAFGPKPSGTVHATLAAAEAEKARQREHLGENAAICITPVFPNSAKRERDRKAEQESLTAAGWPIQMRPPRPGIPATKGRRK
jgi:hypothetical protein